MSSSQGGKSGATDADADAKSASWSDEESKSLISICQGYHKQNGVSTHFDWVEIAAKLTREHKRLFTKLEAKNKFDYMKKVWRVWCELQNSETGLGWSYAAGTVTGTDEWWNMKSRKMESIGGSREKTSWFGKKHKPNSVFYECAHSFSTYQGLEIIPMLKLLSNHYKFKWYKCSHSSGKMIKVQEVKRSQKPEI